MKKLLCFLISATTLLSQINADVYIRNINSEQDIYPHRPWTDITPSGGGIKHFRVHTANLQWQDNKLILASRPNQVTRGGGGCDSWGTFEIDLITIDDVILIDKILHSPDAFEYSIVTLFGTGGWLIDPTTWFIPSTYPISYKRVSVYDDNMSG